MHFTRCRKKFLVWAAAFLGLMLLASPVLGAAVNEPQIYFQCADPVGDDHGFGTYQYPTNVAFNPYQGLFDITGFKVWSAQTDPLCFDTSFGKITNPWMAPEGFIHQNLRIFVDSVPDQGMTALPQPGACVTFNPRFAWDFCLKIVGWGSSQLIKAEQGKLTSYPLKVALLSDGQTVRAIVPTNLVGNPTRNWHYYVLVGSYDGFGNDFFRKVAKEPGEWVIGGGSVEGLEPQVMDILAPEQGKYSQVNQLRSFDVANVKMAELFPVGPNLGAGIPWIGYLLAAIAAVMVFVLAWIIRKKPKQVAWFWVRLHPRAEDPPEKRKPEEKQASSGR